MTQRQLRQHYCNFFYLWIISENIKVMEKHIQSCTTFLNNSAELCDWLERRDQSEAFEPSAAVSRNDGSAGKTAEMYLGASNIFIHSLLVGEKNEFCIGSLTRLKGSGLWGTLWSPKNLLQTPYRSPVWSGSEKRADACLAETPPLSYSWWDFWGRLIKQGQPLQSTFSGSQRPSDVCRPTLSWKTNRHAAALQNKPPRFDTRVQKDMSEESETWLHFYLCIQLN